jgi:large subunit ribosomal protein L5
MAVKQTITAQSVLHKIVVNVGIGRMATSNAHFDEKILPEIIGEFKTITGQKPALRHAVKSIAGFKLRQGTIVGMNATLRGRRMRDFLERLNAIVFPRVRDFRGIPVRNIDANGNLTVGIREHTAFPEIVPENSKVDFGMEVTLVLKAQGREKAADIYYALGVPLQKPKEAKVKAK